MFEQVETKTLPSGDDSARKALQENALGGPSKTPETRHTSNTANTAEPAPAESANAKRIAEETKYFTDLYQKENFDLPPISRGNGAFKALEQMEEQGKISFSHDQLVAESKRIQARDFKELGHNYYITGEQTKFWTDHEIAQKVQDLVNKPQGIDISNHQNTNTSGPIDWKQVKDAGYQFVFIKATEGSGYKDPYFETNRDGARDAGLKVGYYHYFHPEDSVDDQVKSFVSKIGGHVEPDCLRLYIDAEDPSLYSQFTVQQRVQEIDDFCQGVKNALGVAPQIEIYCNPDMANNVLGNSDALKKYGLFIANYEVSAPQVPSPWSKWDFWQYSEHGHVPGISGDVDLDVYNGTDLN